MFRQQASETVLPGIRFVSWFESLWQQMQIAPNNVNWHSEHTNWLSSQIQLMHGELQMTSTNVFYRVVNIYLAQAPSVPLDFSSEMDVYNYSLVIHYIKRHILHPTRRMSNGILNTIANMFRLLSKR